MPSKKPRKLINGIEHVECPRCGTWHPIRNRSYLCYECKKKYFADYHRKRYKKKIKKTEDPEMIKKELNGEIHISNLYAGCSLHPFNDQGDQPDLSPDEIKTIREMIAHRIHNGYTACCSVCGTPLNIPTGSCGICHGCGAQIGGGCPQ